MKCVQHIHVFLNGMLVGSCHHWSVAFRNMLQITVTVLFQNVNICKILASQFCGAKCLSLKMCKGGTQVFKIPLGVYKKNIHSMGIGGVCLDSACLHLSGQESEEHLIVGDVSPRDGLMGKEPAKGFLNPPPPLPHCCLCPCFVLRDPLNPHSLHSRDSGKSE